MKKTRASKETSHPVIERAVDWVIVSIVIGQPIALIFYFLTTGETT
tara:strand:- start:192 stop:329 length:138 start_codon:yes stop_codon:yes gene_type:complete